MIRSTYPNLIPRWRWAACTAALILGLYGCKQGEGDRCQVDSDCEDGLACCDSLSDSTFGYCQPKCTTTPDAAVPSTFDGGKDSQSTFDGGEDSQSTFDGGEDSQMSDGPATQHDSQLADAISDTALAPDFQLNQETGVDDLDASDGPGAGEDADSTTD